MSTETNATNPQKKFWKDYYVCKKPHCPGCLQQGITGDEYKFCSQEKQPITIYDDWGKKVVHTFNHIYACNVYHWTIYQSNIIV